MSRLDWVLRKKKVYRLPFFFPNPPPIDIFFPPILHRVLSQPHPGLSRLFFLLPPPYSPLFILDLCFSFLFGPTRLNLDANAAYGCVSVVHMGRFWTSYADVSVSLAFISPFLCYFPSCPISFHRSLPILLHLIFSFLWLPLHFGSMIFLFIFFLRSLYSISDLLMLRPLTLFTFCFVFSVFSV